MLCAYFPRSTSKSLTLKIEKMLLFSNIGQHLQSILYKLTDTYLRGAPHQADTDTYVFMIN